MITRNDPRVFEVVCALCKGGEFDHDRGAYGRCFAFTAAEYERLTWRLGLRLAAVRR